MKNTHCKVLVLVFSVVSLPLLLSAQWLETTIAVGDGPGALVYNPTSNKIYCANWGTFPFSDSTITVIDGATNAVITTITAGAWPRAFVYNPDDNKIYSAHPYEGVTVIDGATNVVITTIAVGDGPGALVYNPANNKVYCAN